MTTTSNRLVDFFHDHTGYVSDRWEHYLAIYQLELAPLIAAGKPLKLLEVGVQNGGSLQIWSQYLPAGSEVVGIDIDKNCTNIVTPSNARILIGDAADPLQLLQMLDGETFDIIIDDGSHRSPDIVATFETGFGFLNPGGLYVVEDLHCSYLRSFGGGYLEPHAAVEWFKGLVDALNSDHLEEQSAPPPDERARLKRLNRAVARVAFYDSVAVIEKSGQPKTQPFRRVLTGSQTPVADVAPAIWSMPPKQIEAFRFAPATAAAFSSTWTEILVAAKQDIVAANQDLVAAKQDVVAAQHDYAAAIQEVRSLQAANASEGERLVEAKRQLADSLRERAAVEEAGRLQRASSEAALRKAEAAARSAAEQAAGLHVELLRLGKEISENRTASHAALADYAELYNALAVAKAQVDTHLYVILTSTSWQVMRRVTAVAAIVPPGARRLVRRLLRLISWTVKGQIRTNMALYRSAHDSLTVEAPGPRPASAPIAPTLQQRTPGHLPAEPSSPAPLRKRPAEPDAYQIWWAANAPHAAALRLQRRLAESLELQPTFSVIVPVFQPPEAVFIAMVASVQAQSYRRWELVLAIVDTGAPSSALLRHASQASQSDPRIRFTVLPDNLGIAGNSNAALALATGDWIVLLDHDDEIGPDALFRFAESLSLDPAADFLYSDKDMIDLEGKRHFSPLMKPAWSPDIMLNANFLTHLCALRTDLVRGIGGWNPETDGAQDWDLFLRAYLAPARIRHIPYVLYHWRQIPTSVSMGGFTAKPYAADAQLRTLRKYLPAVGWDGGEPEFGKHYIRIRWAANGLRVSVIVVGSQTTPLAADQGVEVFAADPGRPVGSVDAAIARASGDVVIVLDAAFVPQTTDWIAELAYPLSNPAVAMVTGKVLDRNEKIVDFGILCQNGVAYPAFRHGAEFEAGTFGGAGWYWNVSAAAGGAVAFRRTLWSELGGFAAFAKDGRADLGFSLAASKRGRILANPFALFTATDGPSVFEKTLPPLKPEAVRTALPNGDPYLNPNLQVETTPGLPLIVLPEPPPPRPAPYDFAAEARDNAYRYDVEASEIAASIKACSAMAPGPLRHMLWLIPGFQVPFFGGIHTILRVADYMRLHHDVKQSFAVYGETDIESLRARIARAFPDLAATARIKPMAVGGDAPSFGPVDVAFATLWSTAFPLLRMRDVRRKCYFLQDWEPLFYPAGTISGIVEATYRFGFHAICNTPSLADSYRAMGGTADYFLPAVDGRIFNAAARAERRPGDPFVLFCYGRPTTPRNCFEVLAEGLAAIKRKYGDAIEIVFAGADWDPADYGLAGMVRNLGLLSYAGTGQLYRAVDAGLVAMATRHPSYLPFELMACGAAVVTTRNIHTSWLLEDNDNCLLCEATRSDIVRAISVLIDQPDVRNRIAKRGQEVVARDHADWDGTCRRISDCIRTIAE
jgi:glycosyltransferase involved in cell wall biosynthesis/SAM-dependent methyltransferase